MPTIQNQVAAAVDDACDALDGSGFTHAGAVEIENAGSEASTSSGGFRFSGVNVPNGATIVSAVLEVYGTVPGQAIDAEIYGNDVDNAANFSTEQDVSDRVLTTAFANWADADLEADWNSSPNFSSVIQEIVNRAGWVENNAIVIIVLAKVGGSEFAALESYDTNSARAAKLTITYNEFAETADVIVEAMDVRDPVDTAELLVEAMDVVDLPTAELLVEAEDVVDAPPKIGDAYVIVEAMELDNRVKTSYSGGIVAELVAVQVEKIVSGGIAFTWVESLGHAVSGGISADVVSIDSLPALSGGVFYTWHEPIARITSGGISYVFADVERTTTAFSGGIILGLPSLSFCTSGGIAPTWPETLARVVSGGVVFELEQPIEATVTAFAGGIVFDLVQPIEAVLLSSSGGIAFSLVETIEVLGPTLSGGVAPALVEPLEPLSPVFSGGITFDLVQFIEPTTAGISGGILFDLVQPIEVLPGVTSGSFAFRDVIESAFSGGVICGLVQLCGQPLELAVSGGIAAELAESVEILGTFTSGGIAQGLEQPIEALTAAVSGGVAAGAVQPIEPLIPVISGGVAVGVVQIIEPIERATAGGICFGVNTLGPLATLYSGGLSRYVAF